MLTVEDIQKIHQVIALYGHIIDEREYSRIHELFTDQTIYDTRDFDGAVRIGSAAIKDAWVTWIDHPLAHHATNILVTEDSDGTIRAVSKGIGVRSNGVVGSTVYRDVFQRTAGGWRIVERVASRRRGDALPAIS
jgi:3-phenylpropionate/cinnamic acid dioxygenase small subunit